MSVILIDGGDITVVPDTVRAMTVHDPNDCAGRTCVIHAPTDHHMRSWPLHWRGDRGIFERLCPHRIGHPDPDQRAYWLERGRAQVDASPRRDEWLTEQIEYVGRAPSRGAEVHAAVALFAGAPADAVPGLAALANRIGCSPDDLTEWASPTPLSDADREDAARNYADAESTHGCDGCCSTGAAS